MAMSNPGKSAVTNPEVAEIAVALASTTMMALKTVRCKRVAPTIARSTRNTENTEEAQVLINNRSQRPNTIPSPTTSKLARRKRTK